MGLTPRPSFPGLPDILTPKQVADFLKVSEATIKRALKSRQLIGFKVGRDWRVEKERVIDWILASGSE